MRWYATCDWDTVRLKEQNKPDTSRFPRHVYKPPLSCSLRWASMLFVWMRKLRLRLTSHWPTIRVQNPGFKPRSSETKPSCLVHCQRFSNCVPWNSQGAIKPHSHLPREEKRLLWAPFSAPWAATPLSHMGASMPMSSWRVIWFCFWRQ